MIPRAKITAETEDGLTEWTWTCSCGEVAPFYLSSYEFTANDAREHLRDVHGVRTVGSLTAKDRGKWIEMPSGSTDWIIAIKHDARDTEVYGGTWTFTYPHATPCRVTEARP